MDAVELGTRIARAREMVGRTQGSLGESLDLDRSAVSRIEQGERKVSVTELLSIAQILARPLSFFVAEAVPAVVSRRRDGEHAHESNLLLDEEIRAFSSDIESLLALEVLQGINRDSVGFRTPRDHQEAEQRAVDLRQKAGVGIEPLLDLGQFAEGFGLVTLATGLTPEGPDGGCVEVGELGNQVGVAVVNGQAPPGRRRMTLAHELGHWLCGDAYDHEASHDAEQMLNSFAVHLLAPRAGVLQVWEKHADWSLRERAVAVSSTFRLSWSAAASQLRNLGIIDHLQRKTLVDDVPTSGEFARLGFRTEVEPPGPYLSPGLVSKILLAYTREELTAARTLELLRGTIDESSLPPLEPVSIEHLRSAFVGHGA